jgi:hypothetical protein
MCVRRYHWVVKQNTVVEHSQEQLNAYSRQWLGEIIPLCYLFIGQERATRLTFTQMELR